MGGGVGGGSGSVGKPPCTFFLRGMCAKGVMCAFSHGASNMAIGSGATPPGGGAAGGAFAMGLAASVQQPSPPLQPTQWAAAAASHKAPPVPIDAGLPSTSPFARSPFNPSGAAADTSPVRMNQCPFSLSVRSDYKAVCRRQKLGFRRAYRCPTSHVRVTTQLVTFRTSSPQLTPVISRLSPCFAMKPEPTRIPYERS